MLLYKLPVQYMLSHKGVTRGWAQASQSKCCFRFLGWILAETCLKCTILVTNIQKSPSSGGFPSQALRNLQCWWPEVPWFGQIVVFEADYDEIELKNIVMTTFQWRHHHYVTKKRHQNNVKWSWSWFWPDRSWYWKNRWSWSCNLVVLLHHWIWCICSLISWEDSR